MSSSNPTPLQADEKELQDGDKDEDKDDDDIMEIKKSGHEDYFELTQVRKSRKQPPATKELEYIPKDKLGQFKELYEQQPQSIKRMMRLAFFEGKPVVKPPPLAHFVSNIRTLREKKRAIKHAERAKLKERFNKAVPLSRKGDGDKISLVDVHETEPQLVHVDYPARIVNPNKAIETMGGIGNITKTFNNPNKKLHVRFRPEDPSCNPVKGDAVPSVGILLKVRFKKPKIKEREECILPMPSFVAESATTSTSNSKKSGNGVTINGQRFTQSEILYEDSQLLKKAAKEDEHLMKRYHNTEKQESYIRLPKKESLMPDSKIKIEALGIINRTYQFEGVCDYQYLPLKKTQMGVVSNRAGFFPVVGTSSDNIETLFASDLVLNEDGPNDFIMDLLPPSMSRIDKPLNAVAEHIMDSDNQKYLSDADAKGTVATTRVKRNLYTIFFNIQAADKSNGKNHPIPTEPVKEALEDLKKRPVYENMLEKIRKLFEEKPIWNRASLEFESKQTSASLKHILPCLAYYSTNGPWRTCWIRFGYDPRQYQSSFLYQTVDFRVPTIYRGIVDEHEFELLDESFVIFRPNYIPPRMQMFYQLCHLKCDEVDKLISNATEMTEKGELTYDTRHGWLKEGTFDYIRQVLIQYLECKLEEQGKIAEHPITKMMLKDGELEPQEKFVTRPRTVRRMRRVNTYRTRNTREVASSSKKSGKGSKKKQAKGKQSQQKWAYQGILEDLSIRDINTYGKRQDGDQKGDDNLLSDADFDYETESSVDESEDVNN